jgi:hypothetical protein
MSLNGRRGSAKGPGAWGWVAAAVIILLILGYIPLARWLFEDDIRVEYSLRINGQYDGPGQQLEQPEQVELVNLAQDGSYLIEGILWEKAFLDLLIDGTGTPGTSLEMEAVMEGRPDQMWLHLADQSGRGYYARPLYLKMLEDARWSLLEQGGLTLYQDGMRFSGMDDFISYAAVDHGEAIGLAGLSPEEVVMQGFSVPNVPMRDLVAVPLRGAHVLECLVGGDRLDLEVAKRDLNRLDGNDAVSLRVTHEGATVYEGELADDGNVSDDWEVSPAEVTASVRLDGLAGGIYRVELTSHREEDDFLITRLECDAGRAVFADHVFTFDPGEVSKQPVVTYPGAALWMSSAESVLAVTTWHPERKRAVLLGGEELVALEGMTGNAVTRKVEVPAGDKQLDLVNPGSLILDCPGAGFSFVQDALFDPGFSWLQTVKDHPETRYDLVLARGYIPPESTDSGIVVRAEVLTPEGGPSGGRAKVVLEKQGEAVIFTSLRIRLE